MLVGLCKFWDNVDEIRFYNLKGDSYANSFQVELNYSLAEHLELRTAYKYYDVETDFIDGRNERILTPSHRIFGNLGYETNVNDTGQWRFDVT